MRSLDRNALHKNGLSPSWERPFEEKSQDVQPPSFDFTQRSKEGDKDVAPPGVVWTEEGTHKGCPYGDSCRDSREKWTVPFLEECSPKAVAVALPPGIGLC